jgi:ribosomal protein S6
MPVVPLEIQIFGVKNTLHTYKIQGHAEGYYVVYKLELPEDKAEEIRKELNHQPELLRFMLLKDGEGEFSVKVGKKGGVLAFDTDIKDLKD